MKGFMQTQGIDYDLTNFSVSRISTLCMVRSLAVRLKFQIHQIDLSTAFFNSALDGETIFVKPLPGYEHLIPEGK